MNTLKKLFKIKILFMLVMVFAPAISPAYYTEPPIPEEPVIVEVRTAAPGVIVVIVETGPHGSDYVSPMDTNPSSYRVDGEIPDALHLYSIPYDELYYSWDLPTEQRDYFITVRHRIYLDIGQPFQTDHTYSISTPYGNTSLTYNDQTTFCESIKVNQVGYYKGSTVRYANLGIYMGDGGSRSFSPLPTYQVIRENNGEVVASGTTIYMGDDTGLSGPTSGEHVYRLFLNNVPEGGLYYVSVPGFGRSYPFGVGINYTRFIAFTLMRGFYHQRCGIALEEPFTQYTRAICHTLVEDSRYPMEGNDKIPVPTGDPTFSIAGGYHDAGDFDRSWYHTVVPTMMLSCYEAFKDHFIDGQYNIPESGNGIPDILDEAMWGTLVWEYLQIMDAEDPQYGGVRSGTEQRGHEPYGYVSAATEQTVGGIIYGTWEVSIKATTMSCGLFAHLSRILTEEELLSNKAADLLLRAERAWEYVEKTIDVDDPENHTYDLIYAALQLYLATGNQTYHDIFLESANNFYIEGISGEWPDAWLPGNSYANGRTAHFISYLLPQSHPVDSTMIQSLKERILYFVNRGTYMSTFPEDDPYPSGLTQEGSWGNGTAQGIYADVYMFAYALTDDPAEKQTYLNIVSQYADYSLGLNPLNMSFVTGLGFVQPVSPCHCDSYFTKYGESDGVTSDHVGKPKGNVPGIVIYGTTSGHSSMSSRLAVVNKLYPEWDDLPYYRHWGDGWSLIANNEFTIHETMIWNTIMYAFLYDASEDPNADDFTNPNLPDNWPPSPPLHLDFILHPNFPNPFNQTTTIEYVVSGQGNIRLVIYDLLGREIKVLFNKYVTAGTYNETWDGTDKDGNIVKSGVYFCYISGEYGNHDSGKMIFLK